MFFKKKTVPATNETKQIDVVQTWEVRWYSRHGEYSWDIRPEVEVFKTEKEAMEFKTSLENAFSLLKHTSRTTVSIKKQ